MPFKDNEKRKNNLQEWRRRRYTRAYMRWLYQKRALPRDIEKIYENALRRIRTIGTHQGPANEAIEALEKAAQLRREVGNRFNHDTQTPYWKE